MNSLPSKLQREVSQYLKENYYHLDSSIMQFMYFGLDSFGDSRYALKILHTSQAFISNPDRKWEAGLEKIGRKYGISLCLPPQVYTRHQSKL